MTLIIWLQAYDQGFRAASNQFLYGYEINNPYEVGSSMWEAFQEGLDDWYEV